MYVKDSNFTIKKDNVKLAFQALYSLYESYNGKYRKKFEDITFPELFEKFRWSITMDDDGNVCGIAFNRSISFDEKILFQTIAPFVEVGSYIEMEGENYLCWRWVFDGKECKEIYNW